MGSVYKRRGSKNWWIAYSVGKRQHCESTGATNKTVAKKILAVRESEVVRGKFHLPTSTPPTFKEYAAEYLKSVEHPNTHRRYTSSINNLLQHFAAYKISEITPDAIAAYQKDRLAEGVRSATINRDLAVLRHMLRLAERKRLIGDSPFREVEFLEERKQRRKPHILTFKEEDAVLSVADPHVRMLAVLILETAAHQPRRAGASLGEHRLRQRCHLYP